MKNFFKKYTFNIFILVISIITLCSVTFNIKLTIVNFHAEQECKINTEVNELVIRNYDKYIKINPFDKYAYFVRGKAHFFAKDYKLALKDFKKSKTMGNDSDRLYNFLGNSYSYTNEIEKSIETFTEGLKIHKDNAILLNNRAYIKCINGYDLQDALKDVNESLAIETAPEAYHTRAEIQRNLGFYQYAISDAEKALEKAPDMYYNHCEKGYSHMKLGQKNQGLHHLGICKQASEAEGDDKYKSLYEEYLK